MTAKTDTTPETLLSFLAELDGLISERDHLRARVAELEAKRMDNRAKLTKSEVDSIHGLRRAGLKLREIAEIYDVNDATVSRIVRGEYHK